MRRLRQNVELVASGCGFGQIKSAFYCDLKLTHEAVVAGKKVEVNWHRELRRILGLRALGLPEAVRFVVADTLRVRSNLHSLPPGPSENEAILRATPEVGCTCALSKRKEPSRSETLR